MIILLEKNLDLFITKTVLSSRDYKSRTPLIMAIECAMKIDNDKEATNALSKVAGKKEKTAKG